MTRPMSALRPLGAVLAAWLWLGCASEPAAPPPYTPPAEWLSFQFDGRDWKVADRTRTPLMATEVYVLPGETPKEWTELVTVSLSFGAQRGVDMQSIVTLAQKTLEKECPALVWNTLLVEKRDAMFEWSRPNCKKDQPAQTEIVRISFGRLGVHRLTYQAKRQEVAPGLKRKWTEALRSAKLGPREPEQAESGSSGD
jgi:hypothetical protein